MKYFFLILFTGAFIIPELIQGLEKHEKKLIKYIVYIQKIMEDMINTIIETGNHPSEHDKLIAHFKYNFTRSIEKINMEILPDNYQQLINRYETIVKNSIEKYEEDLSSVPYKIFTQGKRKELMRNFINNIKASLKELAQVELYPGNNEELREYLLECAKFMRLGTCIRVTDDYFTKKCTRHYKRMKNNDNIECEFTNFLENTKPYIHKPTSNGEYIKVMLQLRIPSCNCWNVNDKEKTENIYVLDHKYDYKEFVFTLKAIHGPRYILELHSGWQNLNKYVLE